MYGGRIEKYLIEVLDSSLDTLETIGEIHSNSNSTPTSRSKPQDIEGSPRPLAYWRTRLCLATACPILPSSYLIYQVFLTLLPAAQLIGQLHGHWVMKPEIST
jgi:hypothetical protein